MRAIALRYYMDGLANIETIPERSYRIAFYTNNQIATRDESGIFILQENATAFTSFTISYTEGLLSISESSPTRPDKITS